MPRYHFHTHDHRDVDGHILPSLEAAKCEAVKLAGQIVCDDAPRFWDGADWVMTVTDDNGLTLFQLQIIATESAAIRGRSSKSA